MRRLQHTCMLILLLLTLTATTLSAAEITDDEALATLIAYFEEGNPAAITEIAKQTASQLPSAADRQEFYNFLLTLAAIHTENPKIIDLLVSMGAEVNNTDNNGQTPLFFAIDENNLEAIKALLKNGANPSAVFIDTENNFTIPLICIAAIKSDEAFAAITAAGGEINTPFNLGTVENNELKLTPLHYLITLPDPEDDQEFIDNILDSVELLIASGADVNATDNYGQTPLDYAYANGLEELSTILSNAGATTGSKK